MKRAKFKPLEIEKKFLFEQTEEKPCKEFVPGQSLDLKELIARFDAGQRLNVHNNFAPGSNFTNGRIEVEDFDDAPPDDVHDIVDVERYYSELQERKAAFKEKNKQQKKKKSEDAPGEAPAPQEPPKAERKTNDERTL